MGKKSRKKKDLREHARESAPDSVPAKAPFYESPLLHIVLIAVLTLIIYSNTFQVPFQWDEKHYMMANPIVKDLGYYFGKDASALRDDHYEDLKGRPVGYLSFALNHRFGGFDVTGFHVVNVAVHVLNGILVYLLVTLTLKTPFLARSRIAEYAPHAALFTALLFVAHPIQTEAVTYVFQRLASLAASFYLLSLAAYIKSRLSNTAKARWGFYALSLFSAVVAMKTKENAFTLPVVIAMYEFLFFRGGAVAPDKKGPVAPLWLVPFMLTMAIIPLAHLGAESATVAAGDTGGLFEAATRRNFQGSRWHYLFSQFAVLVTYLRLLVLPVGQNLVHDYPIYLTIFTPRVFLSFLFLSFSFALGIYLIYRSSKGQRKELRLLGFGILWFFITISVESSVIPISTIIDEYRVYLPSVGLFGAFATAALSFGGARTRRAAVAALAVLVIIFSVATYARNQVWKTRVSLWEDVAKKSPGHITARSNLGRAYLEELRYDEAIVQLEKAIELRPNYINALSNLGIAYKGKGQYDKAVEHLSAAIVVNPNYVIAHVNLGIIYNEKGMADEAARHFINALALNPKLAEAHHGLGITMKKKGMYDEALKHLREAVRLDPTLAEARFTLGAVYVQKRMLPEAEREFTLGLTLRPGNPQARTILDRIREQLKRRGSQTPH